MRKDAKKLGGYYLRCKECKKGYSLIKILNQNLPKIELAKLIHIIFLVGLKLKNWQITMMINISETILIKIKKELTKSIETFSGPLSKIVEIDETECCRRKSIYNPTSQAVETRGTKWVIGAFDLETNKYRLKVLEDRTIPSITNFIRENIHERSYIRTDGYHSYPRAVQNNNYIHSIVNHSRGFINERGEHTNNIESLYSHLKLEIRARRGVMFDKLPDFIKEFEISKENVSKITKNKIYKYIDNVIRNI